MKLLIQRVNHADLNDGPFTIILMNLFYGFEIMLQIIYDRRVI